MNITKSISELTACRKLEIEKAARKLELEQNKEQVTHTQQGSYLKFSYMWGNFDKLLQHLPDSDIHELNLQMLQLICDKLKKNGDT